MNKEECLAAITAGKHLVFYWNDAKPVWAFYEMDNFIDKVLYSQYRKLGTRFRYVDTAIEERIRIIHKYVEEARTLSGIAFIHVEDDSEIFGYWLVVPASQKWALEVVFTQPQVPSIHVHRQMPNIKIVPDKRAN